LSRFRGRLPMVEAHLRKVHSWSSVIGCIDSRGNAAWPCVSLLGLLILEIFESASDGRFVGML
jgi:hypothetical protein